MEPPLKRVSEVPNVGETIAERLKERFGVEGINDLVELDEEDLKEIKGIGEKRAQRIIDSVGEFTEGLEECERCENFLKPDGVCVSCEKELIEEIDRIEIEINELVEEEGLSSAHKENFEEDTEDILSQIEEQDYEDAAEKVESLSEDWEYLRETRNLLGEINDIWEEYSESIDIPSYAEDIEEIEDLFGRGAYKRASKKAKQLLPWLKEEKRNIMEEKKVDKTLEELETGEGETEGREVKEGLIKGGRSYLIKEEKPEKSIYLTLSRMLDREEGLVISRLPPKRIENNYDLEGKNIDIFWLSKVTTVSQLDPSNLELIGDKVIRYFEEGGKTVLLEGIEDIVRENSFNRFVSFLSNMIDMADYHDSSLIVTLDPRTLSERKLATIERKLEIISQGSIPSPERLGLEEVELHEGRKKIISRGSVKTEGGGKINGLLQSRKNGEGFLNGRTEGKERREEIRRKKSSKRKWIPALLIAGLIVIVAAAGFLFYQPMREEEGITIDGDFEDWGDISRYEADLEGVSSSVKIVETSLTQSDDRLSFYMETEGEALTGGANKRMDSVYIFINSPQSYSRSDSFYRTDRIQANYLVKIQGWQDEVNGRLYTYDNSSSDDNWNSWRATGAVGIKKRDDKVEFKILESFFEDKGVKAAISVRDADGNYDDGNYIFSSEEPSLRINQKYSSADVLTSGDTVLTLDMKAIGGELTVNDITFEGEEYFSALSYKDGDPFPFTLSNQEETTLEIEGDLEIDRGKTFYLAVSGVDSTGVETIRGSEKRYYYEEIPEGPRIDGGFGEWENNIFNDPMDMDLDQDIDIREYSSAVSEEKTFFFLGVTGDVLSGTAVPEKVREYREHRVDSDRDGIPDEEDPYPNDFNNDGTTDANSLVNGQADIDGDGRIDYPAGDDRVLNTTIPDTADFPPEYRGEKVEVWIGPPSAPKKIVGDDTLEVYIDSDKDVSTGKRVEGIGADWKITLEGQYKEIKNREIHRWEGSWRKDLRRAGPIVDVGIDRKGIEIASSGLNTSSSNYSVVFSLKTWEEKTDVSVLDDWPSDIRTRSPSKRWQDILASSFSDEMIAYGLRNDREFEYSWWSDPGWSADEKNITGGPEIQWMVNRQCPVRKEKIVAAMVEDDNGNVNISANVWNGSSWQGHIQLATNIGVDSTHRAFDVAYESQSGDGIIFYFNGTAGYLAWRVWNGSGWSSEQTYLMNNISQPNWIKSDSSPNDDEISLMALQSIWGNDALSGLIWDGNGIVSELLLEGSPARSGGGPQAQYFGCFDVEYTTQSDIAVFVWGEDGIDIPQWRAYQSGWSAERDIVDMNGEMRWMVVASDPNSDRFAVATINDGKEVYAVRFDGGNWIVPPWVGDNITYTSENRDVDIIYTLDSNIILVWGAEQGDTAPQDKNLTYYRVYNSSTGTWSLGARLPHGGQGQGHPIRVQLMRNTTGGIFAAVLSRYMNLHSWNYSSSDDGWTWQENHTQASLDRISGTTRTRIEPFMMSRDIPEFSGFYMMLAVTFIMICNIILIRRKKRR